MTCLILSALLLLSALALAEGVTPFSVETTEQKLERMLPVLDSLARAMGVSTAGESNSFYMDYDPQDAVLVWEQLRLMSVNWLARDDMYRAADGVSVPADVLAACAAASFNGMAALPEVPDYGRIAWDGARGAYAIPYSDGGVSDVVIECYAADGGDLVVNCGVYAPDGIYAEGERLGGMTARMSDAPAGAMYPFVVREAHAEASYDFAGLAPVRCDIRRQQPEAAEAEAPVAPKDEGYRSLAYGSRGEAVRAMQARLNELGYNCGAVDGVFGGSTRRAVRYFQDAIGFSQDGVATPRVQSRLFADGAPRYQAYVNLARGAAGIRVEQLQARLRELGYTAMPVDGSFGERTEDAVRRFQRASGLKEDGIAGIRTLKALASKKATACSGYIELRKGDTGSRVSEMQKQLKALGFLEGKASGVYDKKTVDAVRAFLEDRGLEGDGRRASAEAIEAMFQPVPTQEPDPTETPEPDPAETPEPDPTQTPEPDPTETPEPDPTETPEPDPTETPQADPTETPEATTTPEPDDPAGGEEG